MGLNKKCPRCGSLHVQLVDTKGGHGILWLIFLKWIYVIWVLIKWIIGLSLLLLFDWWIAIIYACVKKTYNWQCKKLFSSRRRYYYCHDCGNNFKV